MSNQISQQSTQMQQSLEQTIARRSDSNQSQSKLANEKLSRLIDILKTFAVEQGKIDQALQTFSTEQDKIDQVLQGQKKVEQVLRGRELESKEITDALKDLRRKANVNISRNDDILKKIKK